MIGATPRAGRWPSQGRRGVRSGRLVGTAASVGCRRTPFHVDLELVDLADNDDHRTAIGVFGDEFVHRIVAREQAALRRYHHVGVAQGLDGLTLALETVVTYIRQVQPRHADDEGSDASDHHTDFPVALDQAPLHGWVLLHDFPHTLIIS